MHGGAPRVRRRENENSHKMRVTVDTDEVRNIAVSAAIGAVTSSIVSRFMDAEG